MAEPEKEERHAQLPGLLHQQHGKSAGHRDGRVQHEHPRQPAASIHDRTDERRIHHLCQRDRRGDETDADCTDGPGSQVGPQVGQESPKDAEVGGEEER